MYTFVPNKSFGQLLDILPQNVIFRKTFHRIFIYIKVRFTDQNSKPLEIEDKIKITSVNKHIKNERLLSSTERSSICKRLWIFVFC